MRWEIICFVSSFTVTSTEGLTATCAAALELPNLTYTGTEQTLELMT